LGHVWLVFNRNRLYYYGIFLFIIDCICRSIFVAMGGPISSLSRLTIIQREVPSFKMGKMFSIGSTMISLTIAISLIAGGPIFSYLNPTAAFLTYGGLILLFSLLGLVSLNKDKQNTDRMVRKKSTEMV
jgi:hypothetical protein